MRQLTLSAAMIVRDEAALLGACLESLRGVVDEVVVVDTGSVDGTIQIAQAFGAKVVRHRWNDDFAEARNVSLEHVSGDWVLYIDADERLTDADLVNWEELLGDPNVVAYRLWLSPVSSASAYREYRLWRNEPRIRFDGVIHERVVPAIHRVADEDSKTVELSELRLLHVGYEGDQTAKHKRNLPLLRRQVAIDPSNLFARHHLSRVLDGLGDSDEAEAVLVGAVDFARTLRVADPLACLSYVDLIRMRARRGEDVEALIGEARAAFPRNLVVAWIYGRSLMAAGRYVEAIKVLQELVELSAQPSKPGDPAYDLRLLAEMPWDALGYCRFQLGDYSGAAYAYGQAALRCPSDPSLKAKQVVAATRALRRATPPNRYSTDDSPEMSPWGNTIIGGDGQHAVVQTEVMV